MHLALAIGAFSFGVGELALMGLTPEVAIGLGVPEQQVGHAISAYALGVVIGAPCLVIVGASVRPKNLIAMLIATSFLANVGSALSTNYAMLVSFRFLAGFPHGAYFGLASMLAASIVGPERRAAAVSRVVFGITVAMVIGTPISTYLGQQCGWSSAFWLVACLALVALCLVIVFVPATRQEAPSRPLAQARALMRVDFWMGLLIGAVGFIGLFAVLADIAPVFLHVTSVDERWIPIGLAIFGVGAVIGNLTGGWLFDKLKFQSILLILVWNTFALLVFTTASHSHLTVMVGTFTLGTTLALAPSLQTFVMDAAKGAQALAGALNQAAFNIANALGPLFGGLAISGGFGWSSPAYIGIVASLIGAILCVYTRSALPVDVNDQATFNHDTDVK